MIEVRCEGLRLEVEPRRGVARVLAPGGQPLVLRTPWSAGGAPTIVARGRIKTAAGPAERIEVQRAARGALALRWVLEVDAAGRGLTHQLGIENRGPDTVVGSEEPCLVLAGAQGERFDPTGAWCLFRHGTVRGLAGFTGGGVARIHAEGGGLAAQAGAAEAPLAPGVARPGDRVWIGVGGEEHALLEAWAERAAAERRGRVVPRGVVSWPGARTSQTLPHLAVAGKDAGAVRTASNLAARAHEAGRLWHLGPPPIETSVGRARLETELSLASLGGHVELAGHPDEAGDEAATLLRRALPPLARPLRRVGEHGVAAALRGGRFAVLLWNPGAVPAHLGLDLEALPEPPGAPVHVYEFWPNRPLGVVEAIEPREVPAGGCRLLALTPTSDRPVVVGSSLHVGMGHAEVAQLAERAGELVVKLRHPGRHQGDLWIALPGRADPLRVPVTFTDQTEHNLTNGTGP